MKLTELFDYVQFSGMPEQRWKYINAYKLF